MSKQFTFDKFMKDIIERDETRRKQHHEDIRPETENTRRRLDVLYRERWQNRIRWGRK